MTAGKAVARPSSTVDRLLGLLEPEERELLRRGAFLDLIDEDVALELCESVGVKPGALDEIRDLPFVRAVRGRPGAFKLRDDARRELLRSWWADDPLDSVPQAVQDVAQELADLLGAREGTEPALLVALRLYFETEKALEEWRQLYGEADRAFDLVGCRSLIDALQWIAPVLAKVEAVRDEHAGYLEARGLWLDAWYRTATFELTTAARTAFQGLLDASAGRMLELRGVGGYGKTSHLNWLIARRCVPAPEESVPPPHRVPCARVDFDVINEFAATQEPHLVLLDFAEQLERQFSTDVFDKLLTEHRADHTRLYRHARGQAGPAGDYKAAAPETAGRASGDDVVKRFKGALRERAKEQPVLLVVDTVEVTTLLPAIKGRPALERLVDVLADVQRAAPCIRIVLAGRNHLSDELRGRFDAPMPPHLLDRFTEAEARRYLEVRRRITREDLVTACVEKSRRVPFSIALLADLIDQDPEISAAKIESYPGADYAYLVEKVVKRIDEQPVRWLLRYAALPRRFDYEFVRDVLWPWVLRVMKDPTLDDPSTDALPDEDVPLWRLGELPAQEEQQIQELWERVRLFAGESAWVRPDLDDDTVLRLHSDVARPLRELLKGRPVVAGIHSDAAGYYLRRAEDTGGANPEGAAGHVLRERWVEHLRAAVFHRFQLDEREALAWWEEQLAASESPLRRYVLADELARSPDYRSSPEAPGMAPERDLVSPDTLQRTRLELALAAGQIATLTEPVAVTAAAAGDEWWTVAEDALEQLVSARADGLPPGRLALARAVIGLRQSEGPERSVRVRAALGQPGPSARERLWAAIVEVRALEAVGSEEAGDAVALATSLAAEAPEARDLRRVLAATASQHHRRLGAFDRAVEVCRAAARDGLGDVEFHLAQAVLWLEAGDAARAREAAAAAKEADPAAATLLDARSRRREEEFERAAVLALRVFTLATDDAHWWSRAHALLELGEIQAARLQAHDARAAYGAARQLFRENDADKVADCYLREAELFMCGLGHLRAAGVALDHAAAAALPRSPAALRCRLARAQLSHRLENFEAAQAALDLAADEGPRALSAPLEAKLAVAGLRFSRRRRDHEQYGQRLVDVLVRVTPPVARLRLIDGLERADRLNPQSGLARRLRHDVVPSGGWGPALDELSAANAGGLRLRAAALAGFAGDLDEAQEHLQHAMAAAKRQATPTRLLELLDMARRLGVADVASVAAPAAIRAAREEAERAPLLAAAAIVEAVSAAVDGGFELGEDPWTLLAEAERLLPQSGGSAEAWWGRLVELQSLVAPPTEGLQASLRAGAAKFFDAAGDVKRAEALGSSARAADTTVAVDLRLSGGLVSAAVPGRLSFLTRKRSRSTASAPLRWVLATWGGGQSADPFPAAVPDLIVDDFEAFRRALGELMAGDSVRRRRRRGRKDLEIRLHDGALQPLPWELAADPENGEPLAAEFRRLYRAPAHVAPDARLVRLVQAGLNLLGAELSVDGVEGPDTARALRTDRLDLPEASADDADTVQHLHAARLAGARPRVLIVSATARGTGRRSFALQRRYEAAGFDADVVEESHVQITESELSGEPPPVVLHLIGGLVSSNGVTGIDLHPGAWSWTSRAHGAVMTASDLDRALDAVPPSWPAPIVVVDVPPVSAKREAANQLLLRNCFGGDLFALGGPRAVVGTGLGGRRPTELTEGALVGGLGRGMTIGDVVAQMRRQAPEHGGMSRLDSALAYWSTALWTNDASARLPAAAGR